MNKFSTTEAYREAKELHKQAEETFNKAKDALKAAQDILEDAKTVRDAAHSVQDIEDYEEALSTLYDLLDYYGLAKAILAHDRGKLPLPKGRGFVPLWS